MLVAIAEFFVAFVDAITSVVSLVLEAFGFGVASLASKPENGESRFSGRRLIVAIAPIVLVTLLIGGIIGYVYWQDRIRRERIQSTRKLVETSVEKLASQMDENGHFVKHPTPTLSINDAWGNPLHVTYDQTLTSQRVTVRSAGHDESVGTWDDVLSLQKLPRKKREITMDLLGRAKDAIVNRFTDSESPKNETVNRIGQ